MTDADIVVLGAGPAGLAAARLAGEGGAKVTLVDEQTTPGGQIYRGVLKASAEQQRVLGNSYTEGQTLARRIDHDNVTHHAAATIWRVDEDGTVYFSVAGKAQSIKGRHVIIATGALERPVPVPGWTLPGVMTAGAAQIMLKSSGLVAENAVLIGCGPLLYLVASQLAKAGSPPRALVETQSFGDEIAAMKHLPISPTAWRYLAKGLVLIRQVKAAGIARYKGACDITLLGSSRLNAVQFNAAGKDHRIDCDVALLHAGVVPNTQITRALRLEHYWNGTQRCFHPVSDECGVTSNPIFSVAGDGAGINGAKAAALAGEIAALNALKLLEFVRADKFETQAEGRCLALQREKSIRPFLDALYPPAVEFLRPGDDTMVCRCEEVTAGEIRKYADLGCVGPNQTKAFGRVGMGPCQGRYCGLVVTEILAQENNLSQTEVGAYRIRAPLKPVSLGEIANFSAIAFNEALDY